MSTSRKAWNHEPLKILPRFRLSEIKSCFMCQRFCCVKSDMVVTKKAKSTLRCVLKILRKKVSSFSIQPLQTYQSCSQNWASLAFHIAWSHLLVSLEVSWDQRTANTREKTTAFTKTEYIEGDVFSESRVKRHTSLRLTPAFCISYITIHGNSQLRWKPWGKTFQQWNGSPKVLEIVHFQQRTVPWKGETKKQS